MSAGEESLSWAEIANRAPSLRGLVAAAQTLKDRGRARVTSRVRFAEDWDTESLLLSPHRHGQPIPTVAAADGLLRRRASEGPRYPRDGPRRSSPSRPDKRQTAPVSQCCFPSGLPDTTPCSPVRRCGTVEVDLTAANADSSWAATLRAETPRSASPKKQSRRRATPATARLIQPLVVESVRHSPYRLPLRDVPRSIRPYSCAREDVSSDGGLSPVVSPPDRPHPLSPPAHRQPHPPASVAGQAASVVGRAGRDEPSHDPPLRAAEIKGLVAEAVAEALARAVPAPASRIQSADRLVDEDTPHRELKSSRQTSTAQRSEKVRSDTRQPRQQSAPGALQVQNPSVQKPGQPRTEDSAAPRDRGTWPRWAKGAFGAAAAFCGGALGLTVAGTATVPKEGEASAAVYPPGAVHKPHPNRRPSPSVAQSVSQSDTLASPHPIPRTQMSPVRRAGSRADGPASPPASGFRALEKAQQFALLQLHHLNNISGELVHNLRTYASPRQPGRDPSDVRLLLGGQRLEQEQEERPGGEAPAHTAAHTGGPWTPKGSHRREEGRQSHAVSVGQGQEHPRREEPPRREERPRREEPRPAEPRSPAPRLRLSVRSSASTPAHRVGRADWSRQRSTASGVKDRDRDSPWSSRAQSLEKSVSTPRSRGVTDRPTVLPMHHRTAPTATPRAATASRVMTSDARLPCTPTVQSRCDSPVSLHSSVPRRSLPATPVPHENPTATPTVHSEEAQRPRHTAPQRRSEPRARAIPLRSPQLVSPGAEIRFVSPPLRRPVQHAEGADEALMLRCAARSADPRMMMAYAAWRLFAASAARSRAEASSVILRLGGVIVED
eukprot:Hpha_TRINITY_DN1228_c0_g1::TRINITY_DN1228_c0_g1_i1::g.44749::m.44749